MRKKYVIGVAAGLRRSEGLLGLYRDARYGTWDEGQVAYFSSIRDAEDFLACRRGGPYGQWIMRIRDLDEDMRKVVAADLRHRASNVESFAADGDAPRRAKNLRRRAAAGDAR